MGQDAPPAVTVVIPVHNGTAFLPQSLESISKQNFSDWECIVVDDGSTDDSAKVIHEFAVEDIRFCGYIRLCKNVGAPRAFNIGVSKATGRYIAFLAADDYWLPEFLSECIAVLEAEQAHGGQLHSGVYTDFIEWHEEHWGGMKYVRRMPDFDFERLLREDYVNLSAAVFRRPFWADPRWEPVADWAAVIEASRRGPLLRVPKLLSVRRVHSGQITARRNREMVLKSFLLSFRHSPRAGLWRIREAVLWPVLKALR